MFFGYYLYLARSRSTRSLPKGLRGGSKRARKRKQRPLVRRTATRASRLAVRRVYGVSASPPNSGRTRALVRRTSTRASRLAVRRVYVHFAPLRTLFHLLGLSPILSLYPLCCFVWSLIFFRVRSLCNAFCIRKLPLKPPYPTPTTNFKPIMYIIKIPT